MNLKGRVPLGRFPRGLEHRHHVFNIIASVPGLKDWLIWGRVAGPRTPQLFHREWICKEQIWPAGVPAGCTLRCRVLSPQRPHSACPRSPGLVSWPPVLLSSSCLLQKVEVGGEERSRSLPYSLLVSTLGGLPSYGPVTVCVTSGWGQCYSSCPDRWV